MATVTLKALHNYLKLLENPSELKRRLPASSNPRTLKEGLHETSRLVGVDEAVFMRYLTEAEKSAASEVRHRHREIESRVNKFAQNLHVLEMAVEAVKEGLDPCSKRVCLCVVHRPCGKVRDVAQCFFVLQYYIHKCIGCGYAAVRVFDFEFSQTREGHLGSRPGKRARLQSKIPLIRRMSRAG